MSETGADTSGDDAVAALTVWMQQEVELAPGTALFRAESCGLGLEGDVTLAREKEEPVARVPNKLVLTSARMRELAAEDAQMKEWLEGENLAEADLLQRGLLYLWLEAPECSPWRTYLDSLPRNVGLPFSLSVHEMERLDSVGVSIMYPALLRRVSIERAYLKFKKRELRDVTLEEWLLPHQWISSRALSHPKTGKMCLVPVVDMVNHSSTKANVRFDVAENGDFLLLKVPYASDVERPTSGVEELLLDYGDRSSAEFVYNYGFLPVDRASSDFDELFRVFDPGNASMRDVLDPARTTEGLSPGDALDLAHAYETLLDFFGEEYPQMLRIVRLPKTEETKERDRYKFHNNFVMALASEEHLEVRDVNGHAGLYVDDARLQPRSAFETIIKTQHDDIVVRARELVCRMCRVFATQLRSVPDDAPVIKALAERERVLYEQYADTMGAPPS